MILYSQAARCRPCGMKASLDQQGADALVRASHGGLIAYPCPVGDGWHLRRADAART